MDNIRTKPKLVFFQYRYDQNLPEFLLLHKLDHVKCLSTFFDLTVINEDCDYQQVCDKYQPDITLFESGVNHRTCRRPKITNLRTFPEIPRLGLHNADAWCEARAGFLSDMEHRGIETFFAICTTAAEHMPEIAEKLFIWPNFIDPEIYRDYGEAKLIPVLFSGSHTGLYPWRQKIYKLVSECYPFLRCPHGGYSARSRPAQVICGEQYARTINASWIVPTCGTVAKEVVRKHFEIPGCRSCLVTEKSRGLEAAGFVDMENCVFADEDDILDKLEYLFKNPDELARISSASYELVHCRHTFKERDQILQWFNLQKNLKGGEKIAQGNPFQRLSVLVKAAEERNSYEIRDGLHLALLREGDEKLRVGKYQEAESLYLTCLNYIHWMPEPRFRLALCNLYKGNAKMALSWIVPPLQYILGEYRAVDPDPVEWAYFIICLLCLGKLSRAEERADQFPWLRHQELDRTRWVIKALKGYMVPLLRDEEVKHRCSIHQLPKRSLNDWIEELCMMLRACRQCLLAERLRKWFSTQIQSGRSGQGGSRTTTAMVEKGGGLYKTRVRKWPLVLRRNATLCRWDNPLLYNRIRSKAQDVAVRFLYGLAIKLRKLLPYSLSAVRKNEFYDAVQRLTREEDVKVALILGAARGEQGTEAFLRDVMENANGRAVFCLNSAARRFAKLRKRFPNHPVIKCYDISSGLGHSAEDLVRTIKRIKREEQISYFDAALIDGSEISEEISVHPDVSKELYGARFILLDDINSYCNYQNHVRLLQDPNYVMIAENPGLRKGYSIFKRNTVRNIAGGAVEMKMESSPDVSILFGA